MKKLYIVLLAMISVSSIFAQDRGKNNYQKNGYQQDTRQWDNKQPGNTTYDKGYSSNDRYNNDRYANDRNSNDRYNNGKPSYTQERDRRAAIDRVNYDYDQRISRYRNDRSMNRYERDRRIAEAQRERQQKISSFGKGIITGAIVGLIAGALLSN